MERTAVWLEQSVILCHRVRMVEAALNCLILVSCTDIWLILKASYPLRQKFQLVKRFTLFDQPGELATIILATLVFWGFVFTITYIKMS